MKKHNVLYLFLLLFVVFSCKNDDDDDDGLSNSERITQTWDVQSVTRNGIDDTVNNYDDFSFEFRQNGTYTAFVPQERDGTWEFNENETAVIFDRDTDDEEQAEILALRSDFLQLQFREPVNHKANEQLVVFSLVPR